MAYRAALIRGLVAARLTAAPRTSLEALARELALDRRTIERVLAARGVTFRALQRRATLAALARLRASAPPLSGKAIAYRLGFPSPAALRQFLVRARRSAAGAAKRAHLPQTVPLTRGKAAP